MVVICVVVVVGTKVTATATTTAYDGTVFLIEKEVDPVVPVFIATAATTTAAAYVTTMATTTTMIMMILVQLNSHMRSMMIRIMIRL